MALCAMPSGFHASEPSASLRSGTPNSMKAITPLLAISAASLRRDSSVCCDCPGIEAIGTVGHALLHEQGRHEMARCELGLADQRSERGRAPHPARPVPRKALIGWMLPRREHPLDGCDQAVDRVRVRDRVDGQPVLASLARGDRPDADDPGVPFTTPSARTNPRTVEALVNVTASTAPERSAVRASAGRERGIRVR